MVLLRSQCSKEYLDEYVGYGFHVGIRYET